MAQVRSITIACARTGLITILILLGGKLVVAELLPPRPATRATETTLASKRTKDLVIAITSSDGGLKGGEKRFCVLFQKTGTDEPVDVRDVRVDFTLLVGRIQEEPIKTELTGDRVGRYCGHVNLGKQYYVPASYSAFVFYVDAAGRKRKECLFLSVR